jgi:zinc transport system substrate-binding protein
MTGLRFLITGLLILTGMVVPLERAASAADDTKIRVFVTILPLSYFAERIGGDRVEVSVLVPPGQSPATYEPTPGQMVELAEAQILFTIGVPFEKSLLRGLSTTHEDIEIADTRKGVDLLPMVTDEDHGDEHGHGTHDPHVWLDPVRAKVIARNMADSLEHIDVEHAGAFREDLRGLLSDLDDVHGKISGVLAPLEGTTMYAFHPAYGYFADRYGLRQKAISPGGKEPGPRHLARLIGAAKKEGVKAIFVQPQFSDSTAEVIAREIGADIIPLDPLAHDYIRNLEAIARRIRRALDRE